MLPRETLVGGTLGGLVGGVLAGFLLQVSPGETLGAQAAVYGLTGTTTGWAVHTAHTVGLGLLYASLMELATDWYLTRIMMVTRRSQTAANLLQPLLERFGITVVVTGATGLQFGLVVWLVVLVPLVVADAAVSVPATGLGCVVFGLVLGVVYGKRIER
jgi:hypothetical protein